MSDDLTTVPNIGLAIAAKLRRVGITCAAELRGRDPEELFERLCARDGRQHDLCLLDTLVAAVSFADGGPARPWWEFSRARKAATRSRPADPSAGRRPGPPGRPERRERHVGRDHTHRSAATRRAWATTLQPASGL